MSGAEALVPPTTYQALLPLYEVSYAATPVFGSATALTSATVRRAQAGPVCHGWLAASYAEQPLPAPDHALSAQPRVDVSRASFVPPTAITYGEAAGHPTP